MLLDKQAGASQWIRDLDAEDAFHGPPGWVLELGWGFFTPAERDVLSRWRRMHDAMLARRWRLDQGQRDKPRTVR
jgi:hypothetical protein